MAGCTPGIRPFSNSFRLLVVRSCPLCTSASRRFSSSVLCKFSRSGAGMFSGASEASRGGGGDLSRRSPEREDQAPCERGCPGLRPGDAAAESGVPSESSGDGPGVASRPAGLATSTSSCSATNSNSSAATSSAPASGGLSARSASASASCASAAPIAEAAAAPTAACTLSPATALASTAKAGVGDDGCEEGAGDFAAEGEDAEEAAAEPTAAAARPSAASFDQSMSHISSASRSSSSSSGSSASEPRDVADLSWVPSSTIGAILLPTLPMTNSTGSEFRRPASDMLCARSIAKEWRCSPIWSCSASKASCNFRRTSSRSRSSISRSCCSSCHRAFLASSAAQPSMSSEAAGAGVSSEQRVGAEGEAPTAEALCRGRRLTSSGFSNFGRTQKICPSESWTFHRRSAAP
mmetsp:Transcript_113206/g.359800  ORF Transcript_113206/g.359800 Transcript_113206/m.359800 type:complete len:408 (+) Transcript_113206:166-1389(+)